MSNASPHSPWPGLISYGESEREFFLARSAEAKTLLRGVSREMVTVLYGQSGLGKTSLLQAGLFPKLRANGSFPVRIRLAFDQYAPPLTEQVYIAIEQAVQAARVLYKENPDYHVTLPITSKEAVKRRLSLWEYFHDRNHFFWSARSRLLTPVLVFDQFEEWFTRGDALAVEARQKFLKELHELLDNEPAPTLESSERWTLDRVPLSIVLSLREDYLAQLAGLQKFLPGLRSSELRILPFTEGQARQVIESPAPWARSEEFTTVVLEALSESTRESQQSVATLGAPNYDPAILSLLLNRLFNGLAVAKTAVARAAIVREQGPNVLLDFYQEITSRAGISSRERDFLEEHLVTESGLRNSVALEDAEKKHGVRKKLLEELRDQRLLHFDDRALGHARVELAHDVLCAVLNRSWKQRHAESMRDTIVKITTTVFVALLLAGAVYWAITRGYPMWEDRKERKALLTKRKQVLKSIGEVKEKVESGSLAEARTLLTLKQYEVAKLQVLEPSEKTEFDMALANASSTLAAAHYVRGEIRAGLSNSYDGLVTYMQALQSIVPARAHDLRIAQIHEGIGRQHLQVRENRSALSHAAASNSIYETLAGGDPLAAGTVLQFAFSFAVVGDCYIALGETEEALVAYQEAYSILVPLKERFPEDESVLAHASRICRRLGVALSVQGKPGRGIEMLRLALRHAETLTSKYTNRSVYELLRGFAAAELYLEEGRSESPESAVFAIRSALNRYIAHSYLEDSKTVWFELTSLLRTALGTNLFLAGKFDEAIIELRRAEADIYTYSELRPDDAVSPSRLSLIELRLAQCLKVEGYLPETRSKLIKSCDRLRALRDQFGLDAREQLWLEESESELAKVEGLQD